MGVTFVELMGVCSDHPSSSDCTVHGQVCVFLIIPNTSFENCRHTYSVQDIYPGDAYNILSIININMTPWFGVPHRISLHVSSGTREAGC
jgi:hypothetical protein